MSKRRNCFEDRSVLVTGGAGFIGSHLVEELVRRHARVTVLDDLSHGRLSNLATTIDQVQMRTIDLSCDDLRAILAEEIFDFAFHLAGSADIVGSVSTPEIDLKQNLVAAFRLLDALRVQSPKTRIVFTSSAAVYGEGSETPFQEDDPTRPVSPYGVSKLAVEHYMNVFARLYGLHTVSVRLFPVFGPRLCQQVIYDLMSKIQQNSVELPLRGDGTEMRDFNFVTNAVEALLLVAEKAPLDGGIYNAGSGDLVSIDELGRMICRNMEVRPRFVYDGNHRAGVSRRWSADLSRLHALGYHARIGLAEGLAKTINWFRQDPGQSVRTLVKPSNSLK
jgi:UDP-glucose 4-epimerase